MPLWLPSSDVEKLLDMPAAIEAVADAYRLIHQGEAELPVRANVPVAPYEGSLMSMPAYLSGDMDALGAKLISFYGTNPVERGLPAVQGNVLLFDGRNGALVALMDAGFLTAMRTGASGGGGNTVLGERRCTDADYLRERGGGPVPGGGGGMRAGHRTNLCVVAYTGAC